MYRHVSFGRGCINSPTVLLFVKSLSYSIVCPGLYHTVLSSITAIVLEAHICGHGRRRRISERNADLCTVSIVSGEEQRLGLTDRNVRSLRPALYYKKRVLVAVNIGKRVIESKAYAPSASSPSSNSV